MDEPGAGTPAQARADDAREGNMSGLLTVPRGGHRTPVVTPADAVGEHVGLDERGRNQPCVATALHGSG